jgi:hypothetical protein
MYRIYFMLWMSNALSFKICKVCFKILPNVFILNLDESASWISTFLYSGEASAAGAGFPYASMVSVSDLWSKLNDLDLLCSCTDHVRSTDPMRSL